LKASAGVARAPEPRSRRHPTRERRSFGDGRPRGKRHASQRSETRVTPTGPQDPQSFLAHQDNAGAIASRSSHGSGLTLVLDNWTARAKRPERFHVEIAGAEGDSYSGTLSVLAAGEDR
jgi:hypothetical protein